MNHPLHFAKTKEVTNSLVTNSLSIVVPRDWNGNGVSDGWEWTHFTNLTTSSSGDNDGDGLNNYAEYLAGTQPTNASSRFVVSDCVTTPATSSTTTVKPAAVTAAALLRQPSLQCSHTEAGGVGDEAETATVSGPHAQFAEARLGVKSGKRVDRALIRFEPDGETWTVTAKADDFTFNALRTPKMESRDEEGDDPDAKVLEKLFLLEKCAGFFDALYTQFLNTRLSQGWTGELSDFADWLREGV